MQKYWHLHVKKGGITKVIDYNRFEPLQFEAIFGFVGELLGDTLSMASLTR